uniref:Uncharacterized protein n=1 Tax=Coccidioides posadasii RMSCC 3488 TaxID=454284 RepID=A0A0J6FFQ1_COCPO|nr:hypothetical protein CPAG_04496 [Coccidioides posadasii RMSCC 3488]
MNMHGTWEADFDGQLQDGKDRVERNGVELANVKDEAMLICCPTIPGFSFNKKLFLCTQMVKKEACETKLLCLARNNSVPEPRPCLKLQHIREMCDGEVLSGHKMLLVD